MKNIKYHLSKDKRRIAYHHSDGQGPMVVFLGGFMSDMNATKALHLQQWAKARGQAFLRFDYSGHGQSDGAFTAGCISDWTADAKAIISTFAHAPVILVGSSMGGWISLLLAQRSAVPIAGLITIAAAPDFTEDSIWADMDTPQRDELQSAGIVYLASDYDEPYPITRKLIQDGRKNLVLREALKLPFPVRLLQGSADRSVSTDRPLAILEHAQCDDLRLTFVKGADHSFSSATALDLIIQTLENMLSAVQNETIA